MRSDWDPDHGKRPDLQKRYPDIEKWEWILLSVLVKQQFVEFRDLPDSLKKLKALVAKIEARIGESQ